VENELLRDTVIEFDPKFNHFQIDVVSSGPFSMFRTYYFDLNGPVQSPAVFVDNQQEKILVTEFGSTTELSKWSLPGFDESLFVEGLF
jgi:hypothetical protein